MKERVMGVVLFVLGFLIAVTPRYILPVCEYSGLERMRCTDLATVVGIIGMAITVVSLFAMFIKSPTAFRVLMLVSFLLGCAVFVSPAVVGYCKSQFHPCHYGTVPAIRILGVIIVISSATGYLLSRKHQRIHKG